MEKIMLAVRLVNLCNALNECGIPAEIVMDENGENPILFGALWNCVDGSGVRLEVAEEPSEEGEILACVNPMGCSYEELLKQF